MYTGATERDWSNLPIDLLTIIGDCLNTRVDRLRLRSVCSSWRSSMPIYNNTSLLQLPMELPCSGEYFYGDPSQPFRVTTSTLTEAILYRIEPLDHDGGGWFFKAKEIRHNEFCLLHVDASKILFPLNSNLLEFDASKILFPLKLNLLDYRVFELGRSFVLTEGMKHWKTIFSAKHRCVLAIFCGGLSFVRLGDEKWTHLVGPPLHDYSSLFINCKDIIMYMSEFHAIHANGKLVSIDASSLKITQYSNPFGARLHFRVRDDNLMHLLQGFGNLYVVVQFLKKDMEAMYYDMELNQYVLNDGRCVKKMDAFEIYKLNEERRDWVEVESLGDKVIILSGHDSLLTSTEELAGLRGNCIYFADQDYYHEMFKNKFALFEGLGLGFLTPEDYGLVRMDTDP